jgi:predicted metal-dependent enzyme (double-stranded beta helix superfamily)
MSSGSRISSVAADRYSIAQLVADIERVCGRFTDDRQIVGALRPIARRAALTKASWLEDRMYETDAEQGFGVHLLHEKPDHTLAIFAVSWLPNRGTLPHDHGTWAVVAGIEGPEKNEFFERVDDRSRPGHAELRKIGEKVCGVGDVVAMPRGVIHKVWNETDAITLSLHLYGKHINHTARSQFDLERSKEMPIVLKVAQ